MLCLSHLILTDDDQLLNQSQSFLLLFRINSEIWEILIKMFKMFTFTFTLTVIISSRDSLMMFSCCSIDFDNSASFFWLVLSLLLWHLKDKKHYFVDLILIGCSSSSLLFLQNTTCSNLKLTFFLLFALDFREKYLRERKYPKAPKFQQILVKYLLKEEEQ